MKKVIFVLITCILFCFCKNENKLSPRQQTLADIYISTTAALHMKCSSAIVDSFRLGYSRSMGIGIDSAERYVERLVPLAKNADCEAITRLFNGNPKENQDSLLLNKINDAISWVKSFKPEDWIGGAQSVLTAALKLNEFSALAEMMAESEVASIKKAASQLSKQVISGRQKNFPALRKKWAKFADEKMWESNIDVKTLGGRSTTLELVGGTFASNANIGEAQRSISDAVTLLRFKRVNYRWYDGADEYQYYTIESPADSEH